MKKANEINYKVFNRTNLGLRKPQPNPLLTDRGFRDQDKSENLRLLEQARLYYESLYDFRKRAIRARKYYRGDQWSDIIYDPDSKEYMIESDYIKKQGKVPLKQNIIRSHVRNQLGQFRASTTKSIAVARRPQDRSMGDIVSSAIDYAAHINMLNALDPRAYETALLTGACVQKVGFGYIKERDMEDIIVENRNVHRLFFNPDVADIRGTDIRMIGEIIDATVDQIVAAFAQTKKEEEVIRDIFRAHQDVVTNRKGLSADENDRISFLAPPENGKGRIYEIWYLKNVWKNYVHDEAEGKVYMTDRSRKDIEAENRERVLMAAKHGIEEDEVPLLLYHEKPEQVWHVKYLTYNGTCLWEGETKYEHGEHPYALMLYPLVDGEVWGFVEDIIDQQRYINRTIILLDFIMGASAKGVLLVPEDSIPEGSSPEDFAAEWVKFNGVIVYKAKPGVAAPQQVSANSVNSGFKELISLQMQLIQDISGTHDAIQGKSASSGTAAALYEQETNNAAINSSDFLNTFHEFREKRDRKIMKNILQFYDKPRNLALSSMASGYTMYDPAKVKTCEFDLMPSKAPNTTSYKALIDENLMGLLKAQLIDMEMYLKHTSMPYADALLEDLKQKQQQMAQQVNQGQMPTVKPEEIQQMGADPNAMGLLQQAIGRKKAA